MNYAKMDQEFKPEWLEALRSGKYKQGRKNLRNNRGYCCLGVACEVAGIPRQKVNSYKSQYIFQGSTYDAPVIGTVAHPPSNWKGLSDAAIDHLIEMNDTIKASFSEIADWVEQNL